MWDIFFLIFHWKETLAFSKEISLEQQAFDIIGILIALEKRGYPHDIFLFLQKKKKKKYALGNHLECLSKAFLMGTTTYVYVEK